MSTKKKTIHSEYHQLASVLLCPVESAFESTGKIDQQWKLLNYTAAPVLEGAKKEYQDFSEFLNEQQIECLYLNTDENLSLDAMYCRDASIATDFGFIICNMGKGARTFEPEVHSAFYRKTGRTVLGKIESPGTLEGGDVAWIDRQTLVVGHSYRTNREGIRQLRALLSAYKIQVLEVDLPHYKGPDDVFHLMSVFSPVDEKLAVVYSPLLPIGFRNELLARGYELVEVAEEEFGTMGCNVLAIAPRYCVMVEGNPKSEAALIQKGCRLFLYQGNDISIKGGGGPTCLTRPLIRNL
jgi:N-dimethylarginine dimethylaminohydrolase